MPVTTLIGLAGKTCSGKSTLARHLATRLDAQVLSFGDYVRRIAQSTNLQDSGQQMLDRDGATAFVDKFLSFNAPMTGSILVVDGIRHFTVWDRLKFRYRSNLLVVIMAEEHVLIERLAQKRAFSETEAKEFLSHPIESEFIVLTD